MLVIFAFTHLFLIYWVGHFWIESNYQKAMRDLAETGAKFWEQQNEQKYQLIRELLQKHATATRQDQ